MNRRELLKKIFKYLRPYRIYFILSLVFAAASSVIQLCIPRIAGKAVDYIVSPGLVDFAGALRCMALIALSAVTASLFQWLMNVFNNRLIFNTVRDMRSAAFEKIQILPLKYIDSHKHGDMVSMVIADAEVFADGLLVGFTQFFTGIVTITGTLFFLLYIDLRLGLLIIILTPLSIIVSRAIAARSYNYARKQAESRGRETGFVNEMIGAQKVVRAFNREEETLREFSVLNDELREASLKATFISSLTNPSTRFVNNTVYAAASVAGGGMAIKGLMTVGELVSVLSYAREYTKPFNEISGVITELQNAFVCAERLIGLIEEEGEKPDPEDAFVLKDSKGEVELEDVSFSYTRDKKLIEGFNLKVFPGHHIAIVGPTGCGKTTLINLLMRFYDTDSGEILIDKTDIKEMTRRSLRDAFGMVLQDTYLKSGTIRENLVMGDPSVKESEMVEAAKACHAHSFIMKLPKGYDTYLSEDGGSLSAGQKQLLCIARAMLSKPQMLILDEATSSIDTRTELIVQNAFRKIMEGRTSFIVAHRLSTIREADLFVVMKDGHIIEQGSHDELLKSKGFYYELYQSQFLGRAI